MANRHFNQFRLSLEKQVVDLFAKVTYGASGAPTLVAASSKGVSSISRTSAGLYVITLSDAYYQLLMVKNIQLKASGVPDGKVMHLVASDMSAKTITVQFIGPNGGTVSAPTFTGDALAAHTHDFLVKGGQAAASTDAISIKGSPAVIGKEAATDATNTGGTDGGVQDASAGTPAGTVSAPTFTQAAWVATDPASGEASYFQFTLKNSSAY